MLNDAEVNNLFVEAAKSKDVCITRKCFDLLHDHVEELHKQRDHLIWYFGTFNVARALNSKRD